MKEALPGMFVGVVALIATVAIGCSSPEVVEVKGSTESSVVAPPATTNSCGNYEAKNCDPQQIIDYLMTNDYDDTFNTVVGGGLCAAALVTAGAITAFSSEVPPVAIAAVDLVAAIATASDCQQFVKLCNESGLTEVLSCFLVPCKYSEEGNQRDCEQSGEAIGKLGFKHPGTFNCGYTDIPLEAECRLICSPGTHIVKEDSGECWCPAD